MMKYLKLFTKRTVITSLCLLGAVSLPVNLQAIGDPVDGFAPDVNNGEVDVVLELSDGSILIAGTFTQVEGMSRTGIAKLNVDGTLDTSFDAQATGSISAVAVQSDGKILVGGSFTGMGGETRNRLARLNADGSLDTDFNPNVSSSVLAIALESDGQILIGGTFSTVSDDLTSRSNIARLNEDGTVDLSFDPDSNNTVYALAVQSDGKILVGGTFTDVGGGGIELLARLDEDGTADTGFDPDVAGSLIRTIAVESDGSVVFGGSFASVGGVSVDNFARVGSDGAVDDTFLLNPNGAVRGIAIQEDGDILVCGEFSTIGGQVVGRLARLSVSGAVDSGFVPNLNANCYSVFEQSDGRILAGGIFTTAGASMLTRNRCARFTADGSLEQDFDPGADATVYSLAIQVDGQILLGGSFTMVDGTARNRVARVNPAGEIDSSFNPNADGDVNAFAIQDDSDIVIGGAFTDLNGTARSRLARYSSAGTLDSGFDPAVNDTVHALAVESDGSILVGGSFTEIDGDPDPIARNGLLRLTSAGELDTAFDPNVEGGNVYAIAVQDDGTILIGGSFTTVGSVARAGLAKLNSDGSLDTSFDPSAAGDVYSICVQPDGQILVGGDFTTLAGSSVTRLGRLDPDGSLDGAFASSANGPVHSIVLQADESILVGGDFTAAGGQTRNNIAKLDSVGTADADFDPDADGIVHSVAVRTDGKVVFCGEFANVGAASRSRIAQVTNVAAVRDILLADSGRTVQWILEGASPVTDLVEMELSTDGGTSYTSLGLASRISGTSSWQLADLDLPQDQSFLIRAVGRRVGCGNYYGGGSSFEHIKQLFLVQIVRPDLWLGRKQGRMKGNNVYNLSGSGQTYKGSFRARARFFMRAENDGTATDTFTLKGKRSNRKAVYKYYTLTGGRSNITARVSRGGYSTPDLIPGESVDFLARVTPKGFRNRAFREVGKPTLTSASDTSVKDRGRTIFRFQKLTIPTFQNGF